MPSAKGTRTTTHCTWNEANAGSRRTFGELYGKEFHRRSESSPCETVFLDSRKLYNLSKRCAARGEAAFQTKGNGIEDGRRSVRPADAGSGWPLSGHIHRRAGRNATPREETRGT
ncbi:hypothetical protein HPB50_002953 [Hyalomma asiaticum]|uniref:Uncharacterized protein n=1 Tax=Hyalomma asiaticum TaxID=266040 RepID=A0ACB7SQQ9_HYAAI|nr:hypothetical protein HPB50_002953 [Hyalomma asiaticum]